MYNNKMISLVEYSIPWFLILYTDEVSSQLTSRKKKSIKWMDALSFWKLSYLFNQFRINCSQYFCFNIIIVNKRTKRFSLLWANPKSVFLRENLPELYFCFNFHLEAGLWCWHEALRGLKRGGDYQGERKKRTTGVCVCVWKLTV